MGYTGRHRQPRPFVLRPVVLASGAGAVLVIASALVAANVVDRSATPVALSLPADGSVGAAAPQDAAAVTQDGAAAGGLAGPTATPSDMIIAGDSSTGSTTHVRPPATVAGGYPTAPRTSTRKAAVTSRAVTTKPT